MLLLYDPSQLIGSKLDINVDRGQFAKTYKVQHSREITREFSLWKVNTSRNIVVYLLKEFSQTLGEHGAQNRNYITRLIEQIMIN